MSFFKRLMYGKRNGTSSRALVTDSGSFVEDQLSLNFQSPSRDNNLKVETVTNRLTPILQTVRSVSPERRNNDTSIDVLEAKLRQLSKPLTTMTSLSATMIASSEVNPNPDMLFRELRTLEAKTRRVITDHLDANRGWQPLAAELDHPDRPEEKLFTEGNIQLLSDEKKVKSPTDEILKTWSTTGRNRPKIKDLHDILLRIEQDKIASRLIEELGMEISKQDNLSEANWAILVENMNNGGNREIKPCLSNMYRICFNSQTSEDFRQSENPLDFGEKIGEGNFGTVYKTTIDGQEMAVKRLKNGADQFMNEIEKLNQLQHPNVLSLYGVAIEDGVHCIITRYMPNGTLEDKLRSEILSWSSRLSILRDMATGLEYLHSKEIVHRDIKPANILLDADMTALLADFGLARSKTSGETSITQVIAGTSYYMPLEAYHNEVTKKSDVFAFGVVSLEVLTGLRVYDNSRQEPLLTEHIEGKSIDEIYDSRLDPPPSKVYNTFYGVSKKCLSSKNARPTPTALRSTFEELLGYL